ncbi:MAG: hypothetical protein ACREF3_01635 [Acetobacteraceae bacterium]
MNRLSVFALSLCLCLAVSLGTSHAQVNPFRSSRVGSGLNSEDFKTMNATAAQLYERESVADGTNDKWSNPKSGNGGTITVLQSFTRSDMQCRKVRYDIRLKARTGPRSYTVNWCKTPEGVWKLA